MKPGEIYNIYMRFSPPKQGGKIRPAIIMSVVPEGMTAIAIKVTGSPPNLWFPHRIPLINWCKHYTGLTKPSFAEINTTVVIPLSSLSTYRGELHPRDFFNVLQAFRRYYRV